MSILDTKVDGSIPSINMFSPWARDFIRIASVDSAVKWVPGGDNLVKGVQCYELFGGIALKIHTISFHVHITNKTNTTWFEATRRKKTRNRLSIFYKIINGLVAIPAETHLHFNTRGTRISNSKSLKLPICTTDTFKHSFFPATIKDWNLLPDDIVNCNNLSPFEETIRKSGD